MPKEGHHTLQIISRKVHWSLKCFPSQENFKTDGVEDWHKDLEEQLLCPIPAGSLFQLSLNPEPPHSSQRPTVNLFLKDTLELHRDSNTGRQS